MTLSFSLPRPPALLLLAVALCAASPKHDVHISYCKSELTPTVFSGKVTIYRDDFTRSLLNWKGMELHRLTGPAMIQAVNTFLGEHFTVSANGARLPLIITGTGSDNASIWFGFSFTSPAPIGSLAIGNSILFREYNDQMNLIVVKTPGRDYNFIFTPSQPTATIDL